MATEVSSSSPLPQLQSVQKAMALPTVEAAVGQVGAFYSKVKGTSISEVLLFFSLGTGK